MDRKRFFDALRKRDSGVFGTSISRGQVSGTEAILDEAQRRGVKLHPLAYMLATAYLETGHTMLPIKEYGGEAYFTRMYDIKGNRPKKARELGNLTPGDGARYAGRGYVQLTGKSNYQRASKELGVDFVGHPDRVMEPRLAAEIMFAGMAGGWFTDKKLSDYIGEGKVDYVNARRIINGTDKAKQIAGYAKAFETALRAAGYVGQAPKPSPVPRPQPPAPPVLDDPVVTVPPAPKVEKRGIWAVIGALLKALFVRSR
jgi:putative chitinase